MLFHNNIKGFPIANISCYWNCYRFFNKGPCDFTLSSSKLLLILWQLFSLCFLTDSWGFAIKITVTVCFQWPKFFNRTVLTFPLDLTPFIRQRKTTIQAKRRAKGRSYLKPPSSPESRNDGEPADFLTGRWRYFYQKKGKKF